MSFAEKENAAFQWYVEARLAMAEAKGIALEAAKILKAKLDANPTLYKQVADPLVWDACVKKCFGQLTNTRASVRRDYEKEYTPPSRPAGLSSHVIELRRKARTEEAEKNFEKLFEFTLNGGGVLGDATKPAVLETAKAKQASGSTLVSDAVWLNAIAAKMPNNTVTVRKALSYAEVAGLHDSAKGIIR